MNPQDIGGQIDIQVAAFQKGYGGGAFSGPALDLIPDAEQQYESVSFFAFTRNGSAGDVVDLHLEESTDDGSNWSDEGTELTNLNDASDNQKDDYDAEVAAGNIRVAGDSGDQTVGASVDLIVVAVLGGAHQMPTS
ncbi:MAG: hypothetical protein ABEN55_21680 [Bradymonadaceae bacterium]